MCIAHHSIYYALHKMLLEIFILTSSSVLRAIGDCRTSLIMCSFLSGTTESNIISKRNLGHISLFLSLCWFLFLFFTQHVNRTLWEAAKTKNVLNKFVCNAFKGITMEITYKSLFLHILCWAKDICFTCSKVHNLRWCWRKSNKRMKKTKLDCICECWKWQFECIKYAWNE